MENKLIHFQFAKKGKKNVYSKIKIAHTNTDYIKSFDLEKIGIEELYSELCEVTHPAANSVNCFSEEKLVSEYYSYSITSTETDNNIIIDLVDKYNTQIKLLLKWVILCIVYA